MHPEYLYRGAYSLVWAYFKNAELILRMFGDVDLCAACDDFCSLFRCLCSAEESGKLFVDYVKKVGVGT